MHQVQFYAARRERAARAEARAVARYTARGIPAIGGGIPGMAQICILVSAATVAEERAAFKRPPVELAAWRLPDPWRRRMSGAGLHIPGSSSDTVALIARIG